MGYRRVIPLIGIAPIPNRGCGSHGIGGITIGIATVIGSVVTPDVVREGQNDTLV